MYWQWNDFDPNEAVYYSRTVEGGVYPAGHNDLDRRGRAAVPCGGHFPRRADASCCALCAGCGNARHRCGVHSRGIHGARFRLFRAPHRAHAYLGVRGVSIHSRKARSRRFRSPETAAILFSGWTTAHRSCTLRRKPPVPAGSLAALRAALQPLRRSSWLSCEKEEKRLNKFLTNSLFPCMLYMYSLRRYVRTIRRGDVFCKAER